MANKRFVLKSIFALFYSLTIFGVLLFLPAGTLHWPRAWWFMAVVLIANLLSMAFIFRGNEALLDERLKPPVQKGQPLADRILVVTLLLAFVAGTALIPLDIFRFHFPLGAPGIVVSSIGCILFVVGWTIMAIALRENTFAAPVVKHQADRQQAVVDSGLYGVVRHPMYSGGILFLLGMPLWLGSYTATLVFLVAAVLLVVRIGIEQRFLRRELKGYDAYTQKVRYRLIPHLW
jgi:protein-S-isoprenylcysteine O-methyltransferase Ste14